MKLTRTYNLATNCFSDTYKCDLPLPEKLKAMAAVRKAQEEIRQARLGYYDVNGKENLAAVEAKYWKVHRRRGYEIHEFVGAY